MADKKITQLSTLPAADGADLFPIVDMSDTTTKKITVGNLMNSPGPIGGVTSNTGKFTTLQLSSGAIVNEFSIDGTLVGDSDTAVPTEKAVKTYVDAAISTFSTDIIWADNSYVKVVDDATAAGYVEIVIDGVQSSYFDSNITRLYAGSTNFLTASATSQLFGVTGDSNIVFDQSADTVIINTSATEVFNANTGVVKVGVIDADTFITIDSTSDIITISDNSIGVAAFAENGLTLESGTNINEFSTDGTLEDNSDDAVPTEKAVKTYIDESIKLNIVNVTTDSTAGINDVILVDTTSGDVTIQLIADGIGKITVYKKYSSNNVYIIPEAGSLIDDSIVGGTINYKHTSQEFICDGTDFYTV